MAVLADVVKIEGLAKLEKELGRFIHDLPATLAKLSEEGAEAVAVEVQRRAPVRTGRLRSGVQATKGQVSVDVIYGRAVNKRNPFFDSGVEAAQPDVVAKFEKGVEAFVEKSFSAGTGE